MVPNCAKQIIFKELLKTENAYTENVRKGGISHLFTASTIKRGIFFSLSSQSSHVVTLLFVYIIVTGTLHKRMILKKNKEPPTIIKNPILYKNSAQHKINTFYSSLRNRESSRKLQLGNSELSLRLK